jgi:hypothetical protein
MPKLELNLTPYDMIELCDWVEATDPTLMVESLPQAMRDQAFDAIKHIGGMRAAANRMGATKLQVKMSVTIEGHEDHIVYARMRWREVGNEDISYYKYVANRAFGRLA